VGKKAKPFGIQTASTLTKRNKGFTISPPSLTSNSSLSSEAIDLKVWIQTASLLAKKSFIWIFSLFVWELRHEVFYEADKPSMSMLFLASIFDLKFLRSKTKYQKNCRFCAINVRIIPANF